MRGDGDGWAFSDAGVRYWGRHGAAGILLRASQLDGTPLVLLQHRAWWSHQGDTWALPGGARDSHETAEQAAVREVHEEAGLSAEQIAIRATVITAITPTASGTDWTYTTVVADLVDTADTAGTTGTAELLHLVPNGESTALRWVGEDEVAGLRLHPGFAASWPRLRRLSSLLQAPNGAQRPRPADPRRR